MITPLMESLRPEFRHLNVVHSEGVVRPLREEASTVKLWLARLANLLKCAETSGEHTCISAICLGDIFLTAGFVISSLHRFFGGELYSKFPTCESILLMKYDC